MAQSSRFPRTAALAAALMLAAACSDAPTSPAPHDPPALATERATRLKDWLREQLGGPSGPSAAPAMLAGAGDIAECYSGAVPPLLRARAAAHGSPAAATARLLDHLPGTVVTLGDNAYELGSPFDYLACYDPTWGRHRERTRPSAGNHEYLTPGAAGYFAYFGVRAAPPLGYYSYDEGGWHVVVLNSTPQVYACRPPELPPPSSPEEGRLCAGDLAQQVWLEADLTAHADRECTVAYFHHPRYSSGPHGNHYQMQRIWDILYRHGVDVVLSAHDHLYERFAPQDPDGARDDALGIRQFTVGTGGGGLYSAATREPNSEVLIEGTYGVIALSLGERGYDWAFVAIDRSVRDAGSGECHGRPL